MNDLLAILDAYPTTAKLINGNTEVGIELSFKNAPYKVFINPSDIIELKQVKEISISSSSPSSSYPTSSPLSSLTGGVEFGAGLTLTTFQEALKRLVQEAERRGEAFKARGFKALLDNLKWFAGTQVRNVAALGGNVATASPISDLNPVFVAVGATLKLRSLKNGDRLVPFSEFFLGYRKTALQPGECIVSI
ncbi:xylitol dehydrogenase, partial [Quaeritorhiza haematococci]